MVSGRAGLAATGLWMPAANVNVMQLDVSLLFRFANARRESAMPTFDERNVDSIVSYPRGEVGIFAQFHQVGEMYVHLILKRPLSAGTNIYFNRRRQSIFL